MYLRAFITQLPGTAAAVLLLFVFVSAAVWFHADRQQREGFVLCFLRELP
jgi:hypothetical protein